MKKKTIQAIYPLTSKQQALLFHCLQPSAPDPGFLQVRFALVGAIAESDVVHAWARTLQRHDALRMSLKVASKTVLLVRGDADLPWTWSDVRQLSESERRKYISDYCRTDRQQGIDLASICPMRLAGIRVAEDRYEFIWTCHHLFLDGWSAVNVLQEVVDCLSGTPLSPVGSYRNYLAWIKQQDQNEAVAFWKDSLSESPGRKTGGLPIAWLTESGNASCVHEKNSTATTVSLDLGNTTGSDVATAASKMKVTPATYANAAWAILLAAATDNSDVIFGNTTSGRPADLRGADSIAGFLSGVIPVRTKLDHAQSIGEFAQDFQKLRFESERYEHLPLQDMHDAVDLLPYESLFSSLLVFENLPMDSSNASKQNVKLEDFASDTTSTFPLTVVIKPGPAWHIDIRCGAGTNKDDVLESTKIFTELLTEMIANPEAAVGDLVSWVRNKLPSQAFTTQDNRQRVTDGRQLPQTDQITVASNATELGVASIWEELLGHSQIDVNAEFIHLGGRSITAVRMLTMIEARMGFQVTLADLIAHPTIAGLAKLIDGDTSSRSEWRSLVPIRATSTKHPLFFIHAGGGHCLFLRTLAPYLPLDRGLFGLQPIGLEGECDPMRSFEEIATHYLSEIRSIQPNGPYYFIGHCQGAKVAFEMIRQLKAAQQQTDLFIVLDTLPPRTTAIGDRVERARNSASQFSTAIKRGKLGLATSVVAKFINDKRRALEIHVRQFYKRKILLKYGSRQKQKELFLEFVEHACNGAYQKYVATEKIDDVVLIATQEAFPEHMEWQNLAVQFRRVEIPIGHYRMFMEPEVQEVAKAISAEIRRTETDQSCG